MTKLNDGVDVFGLCHGRFVVAVDQERRLVVTWNLAKTFQVWNEQDGVFQEDTGGWTSEDVPTLAEAREQALARLAPRECDECQECGAEYPEEARSHFGDFHDQGCSLHPRNTV